MIKKEYPKICDEISGISPYISQTKISHFRSKWKQRRKIHKSPRYQALFNKSEHDVRFEKKLSS